MALTRGKERNNKYLREQSLLCLGALICDEAAKTTSLRFKPLGNTVNYLRAPTAHPEIKYEIAITTDTTTAGLFITSKTPGRADAIYNHLHRRKTRIERALGTKLDWDKDKPKRGHKISTTAAPQGWREQQNWKRTARKAAPATANLANTLQPHLQDAVKTAKTTTKTKQPNQPRQTGQPANNTTQPS